MTAFVPPYKQPLVENNNIRGSSSFVDYAEPRLVFDHRYGTATVTNSMLLTDGAAVAALMTESRMKELGSVPLGCLHNYAFTAAGVWQDMLLGPAWLTPLVLERADLTMNELILIGMYEASAVQALADIQLLGSECLAREVLERARATGEVDDSKFNVPGGSIAYGHPSVATGARTVTRTLYEFRRRGGGSGSVTACAIDGLGVAMVLEME